MLRLYEILKTSKTKIAPDLWTRLAADKMAGDGGKVRELTGELPLTFRSNGKPLLDYTIYGNMEQSSTPTPDTPITPSECGKLINGQYVIPVETSEDILVNNLTSQEYNGLTLTKNSDGSVRIQGTATANSNFHLYNDSHSATLSSYQIIDNGTYYIGGGIEGSEEGKYYLSARYDDAAGGAPSQVLRIPYGDNILIDNPTGAYKYLSFYIAVWKGQTVDFTCKPYLKAVSATNNIYLSNAQTTRKIRKLVLTGDESIRYDSQNVRFYFSLDNSLIIGLRITPMFCSHYQCIDDGRPLADVPDNSIYSSDDNAGRWFIKDIDYTSAADFKSFLAQQYANGTPVTIWYILATPETVTINEPIRKIGNYADTVSMEQAGVSISTLNGQTVVDVDTTLKPSKMYIKYKE